MKTISNTLSRAALVITGFLMSLVTFAQDKATDINVDVNSKGSNWYAQPWVWIIGGAIFILLLVALLRSGDRTREA
jgi:hypothetical protein